MKLPATLFIFTIFFNASANAQETPLIAEGAELQLISDGFEFTEGPAADANGNVYFTDQPNNRIHKWSVETNEVSVFMEEAGRANGLYFDAEENLYAAADKHSELWKISPKQEVSVLLDNFRGLRFNGPNDLWIAPDGGIFFTDPFYKRPYWNHSEKPIKEQRVYYLTPNRKGLFIAAEGLVKPNGIIGTPDGKHLFVADIEDNKTWKYEIGKDGKLENKTLFTAMGSDGMTLDAKGNLYLTGNGVTVFNSLGEQVLHIPVDKEWTANVTFGGKDGKTLFITAMDSVFGLEMNVSGK
ncbi:SMP-30/gluconolactonase/LRE family protein [Salinimicrobium oceani]|uniref:SMP-30/gluconolactonase/LRE family protein n=1 Tax=Salinimicrobium oceani TaxID=2722702 RepID=A0ABX1D0W2_9FLAO|nr:SMP-30/gluconolactonase/LRE family protein [Salinimicrobium oceani]NJW52794.1 SMP-30/gluconolactonase/LRE family protein [Salinimicrobium oceani]